MDPTSSAGKAKTAGRSQASQPQSSNLPRSAAIAALNTRPGTPIPNFLGKEDDKSAIAPPKNSAQRPWEMKPGVPTSAPAFQLRGGIPPVPARKPVNGYKTSGIPYMIPASQPPRPYQADMVTASGFIANPTPPLPTSPLEEYQMPGYQPGAYESGHYNTRTKTAEAEPDIDTTANRPSSSSSIRSFWNSCKQVYRDAPPGEGELALQAYRDWRAKRTAKKAALETTPAANVDIPGLARVERKGSFSGSLSSSFASIDSRFGFGKAMSSFDAFMAQREQKKTDVKKAQISIPVVPPQGTGSVLEGVPFENEFPFRAIPKTSTDNFGSQALVDRRMPEVKTVASGKPTLVEQKEAGRMTRLGDFMDATTSETAHPSTFLERCLKCGEEDRRHMRRGLCKKCTESSDAKAAESSDAKAAAQKQTLAALEGGRRRQKLIPFITEATQRRKLTNFEPRLTAYTVPGNPFGDFDSATDIGEAACLGASTSKARGGPTENGSAMKEVSPSYITGDAASSLAALEGTQQRSPTPSPDKEKAFQAWVAEFHRKSAGMRL